MLMTTCTDYEELESFVSSLQKEYMALTVHRGVVHNYLGKRFDFGESGVFAVSTPKYVQEIVEESGVTGRASSPAPHNLFDVDEDSHLSPEAERQNFHSIVPNLLPLISLLTTRVFHATEVDQDKFRIGLRYLNSTKSMGIVR